MDGAPPRVLPYGPLAALVEVAEGAAGPLAAALERAGLPPGVELVPAASTVLVRARDRASLNQALANVTAVGRTGSDASEPPAVVTIRVHYAGPDLDWVAERAGLTPDEVVERHCAGQYVVAFVGFAPGFAYLAGLDPALHLPRRASPRPRVAAGSVAIASGYTAVYPSDSPGGWHLIGRTEAVLWDHRRPAPALLPPGTAVRFVPA